MAKVQMEAALHKGVSWGMAGDDQVCSLYPPLNKPASLAYQLYLRGLTYKSLLQAPSV